MTIFPITPACLAAAILLLPSLALGQGTNELTLKGFGIGDSLSMVRQKASVTCRQASSRPDGSNHATVETRAAVKEVERARAEDFQSCSISKLPSVGRIQTSRFDLRFYSGSLQQIVVNMRWAPRRDRHTEKEVGQAYKVDIAAWVQAIKEQYSGGNLTEKHFRHRASFDVLHWSYPQGSVELTVSTFYISSHNIVLVLEGATFSSQERAKSAKVTDATMKLQSSLAADAQRQQSEHANKLRKDMQ